MSLFTCKIVLIGAGNVATHLGKALQRNHTFLQVVSTRETSAKPLADSLHCSYATDISQLNKNADVYIIAVNDDKIQTISEELKSLNKIVVHTSGMVELSVLKETSQNTGVFYPLQTFSKGKKLDYASVTMCLEGSNRNTETVMEQLSKSFTNNIQFLNSEQRQNIHVAAVFACNFANHMYTIADNLLEESSLSFDILKPLITETASKIKENSPFSMQTGPAERGDQATIDKHLDLLNNEQYKSLYTLVTQSIQNN